MQLGASILWESILDTGKYPQQREEYQFLIHPMELRRCSHLHFINVVRGDLVIKLLNVDTRGKPALVFKQMKDIYDSEDAKTHSLPVFNTSGNEDIMLKADRTCLPITEGEPIGSDPKTFSFSNHGHCDESKNALDDDLSFSSMTLKQLKERCKMKKRKLSKFVEFTKEDNDIGSSVKKECPDLLLEEDDFDLKEPLSIWKSRLTKKNKAKVKKRCTTECILMPSQIVVSVAKSKCIPGDCGFQQSTEDLLTPTEVKVKLSGPDRSDGQGFDDCYMVCDEQGELGISDDYGSPMNCVTDNYSIGCNGQDKVSVSEYSENQGDTDICTVDHNEQVEVPASDYPTTQNVICIADDSSLDCNDQVGFCEVVVSEMPKIDNGSILESRHSTAYAEEIPHNGVNEISYGYGQPSSLPKVCPTFAESLEVDGPKTTDNQASFSSASELKDEGFIAHPLPDDIPSLTSSPTKEHNFTTASSVLEIKEEGYAAQLPMPDISPQSPSHTEEHNSASFLPRLEFKDEEHVRTLVSDIFPQILSPIKEHGSDICNNSQSYSLNSSSGIQVPVIAVDNSLHCVEPSYGGVAPFENNHTWNSPSTLTTNPTTIPDGKCNSSWNTNPCLSPKSCMVPEGDALPATEVKQLLMFASSDTAKNCSLGHSCDTHDEELTSSIIENCEHSELQRGPENLFSARKAISPTSQEKLCRAMNAIGLSEDMEPYKYKIKLRFAKQSEGRTSTAGSGIEGHEADIGPGGCGQGSKNEVMVTPRQNIRRRKNTKTSHPKGILKAPQLSRGLQHLNSTCTSSQSYSQNAIAFSQRQMHDIECLASKLTRELKSMKDIVEETMNSEVSLATSLRYSADEVRTAVENANKVEETTKRWLSMMARDCNRFCKIMRVTENDSVASGNPIHKEKKKITFADEVGGELCRVKIFDDDMASSPLEASGDKQEVLLVK